ncbi:MAG: enoyl-CoA hydratase/isomerase family protein [Desulfobacterales bacterium]|nr:MAG: enoyl-CoA hydratase/isomerase family protein [Desulfobacterales bacterium]
MVESNTLKWPLGLTPNITLTLPERMEALTIHRDKYGPPSEVIQLEQVPVPSLHREDANRVLVAILATGPNFNTNFAALGLPVPVFGRGDSDIRHIPGSDALGIVVDAGSGVKSVKVGDAVILDSWTGKNVIRGYETHDGFNAQFAVVDEDRALPVPSELKGHSPERLAAVLLTHGTAYRAVVERLAVAPGDAVLLMGGGKGTSFAGAQIAKALGARVILMGSNPDLGHALIRRGIADAFIDRRRIPPDVFGVIPADTPFDRWRNATEPFRRAVFEANGGKPVDKIFEHTGGDNFPLLISALADNGRLAFFGATGKGLKGEYKETFFYGGRRFVMDARWVWMRQKQIVFSDKTPDGIFKEIGLRPGRKGLIWGADAYAMDFARAALARGAFLTIVASCSQDREGIEALGRLGVSSSQIIDRGRFDFPADMPDPLMEDGRPNPQYLTDYMAAARALGRAVWGVLGPRVSPDFIVERPDQSMLHFSTFILRDYDEQDEMPCGYIVARGSSNLSIAGSHMYRATQAREIIQLLSQSKIVMEQEDLKITDLRGLPEIQQKMLDGQMGKPKGVALVQADRSGRATEFYEKAYLGETLRQARPSAGEYLDVYLSSAIGIITLSRPDALNALNQGLVTQLAEVVREVKEHSTLLGKAVGALIIRGAGRSFVAGADVTEFAGNSASHIQAIAAQNIRTFTDIENLAIPVIAVVDGFALGGGNELAMSTHFRIVTENARLGQPEIKLGIVPGYGGLQRLPRLVGPRKAAEMSVNGEALDGRTAVAIGLADEFAASSNALLRAVRRAQQLVAGEKPVARRNWDAFAAAQLQDLDDLLGNPQVAELLSSPPPEGGMARDLRAARRYAARFVFEAINFGYQNGFEKGLENDAHLFGDIAASPSGQEWIGRFLAKDPDQSAFLTLLD